MTDKTTTVPAIVMRGVVKRFPGVVASDHVDLQVQAGEIHALLGENGAGKSTLMNILELAEVITGLRPATAGRVEVRGRDMTNQSPDRVIAIGD